MSSFFKRSIIIVILAIYCFTTIATAATSLGGFSLTVSTDHYESSVSGTVIAAESGLPLESGSVSIAGKTATINQGKFNLDDIAPGIKEITINGPYRVTYSDTIELKPDLNHLEISVNPVFDQSEIDILAKITRAEAEGESEIGKIAVAASILNRVKSERYPDTISGVVYQRTSGRYQYSPVADGRINLPPRSSDYAAAYSALAGQDPSHGATGFYNAAKTQDQWVRSHPVTTIIEGHTFFQY